VRFEFKVSIVDTAFLVLKATEASSAHMLIGALALSS